MKTSTCAPIVDAAQEKARQLLILLIIDENDSFEMCCAMHICLEFNLIFVCMLLKTNSFEFFC